MNDKMHGWQRLAAVTTLGAIGFLQEAAAQTGPAELWPAQVPAPSEAGTLDVRVSALDQTAATLPAEVRPAVQFEETFLRIMAGLPTSEWLSQARAFATAKANDPVSAGVREVARAWVARAEMESIGTTLDQYFGEKARYPATFTEIEKRLPAGLKADPWGESWVYRPQAPKGFGGETRQRFSLGPTRLPNLGSLRDAVGGRQPFSPPAWKVTLRVAANSQALEFQGNDVTKGLIMAGGKIGNYSLLYVGDHWALMATLDQLFTVSF